jgi:hypothetical protein
MLKENYSSCCCLLWFRVLGGVGAEARIRSNAEGSLNVEVTCRALAAWFRPGRRHSGAAAAGRPLVTAIAGSRTSGSATFKVRGKKCQCGCTSCKVRRRFSLKKTWILWAQGKPIELRNAWVHGGRASGLDRRCFWSQILPRAKCDIRPRSWAYSGCIAVWGDQALFIATPAS